MLGADEDETHLALVAFHRVHWGLLQGKRFTLLCLLFRTTSIPRSFLPLTLGFEIFFREVFTALYARLGGTAVQFFLA